MNPTLTSKSGQSRSLGNAATAVQALGCQRGRPRRGRLAAGQSRARTAREAAPATRALAAGHSRTRNAYAAAQTGWHWSAPAVGSSARVGLPSEQRSAWAGRAAAQQAHVAPLRPQLSSPHLFGWLLASNKSSARSAWREPRRVRGHGRRGCAGCADCAAGHATSGCACRAAGATTNGTTCRRGQWAC